MIGLVWIGAIQAAPAPTAITLDYFEGFWDGEIVELEWGTGTELNTQGFQIFRAESSTQPTNRNEFAAIVVEVEGELYGPGFTSLIPPTGDSYAGGDYLAFDGDVEPDTTYWYIVVEHENGQPNYYDDPQQMARVDTMLSTPTPTPVGVGGGNSGGTNTPTPTLTPLPTQTPQPTATQNGGSTSTPAATSPATRQTDPTQAATVPQPTSSNGTGGTAAQPTATLANSSSPGGGNDGGQAIAQITPTALPGSYPAPGGQPVEGDTITTDTYPDGQLPTATAYPVSDLNDQGNGTGEPATTDAESLQGNGFPTTGNEVDSNTFLNGSTDQQDTTQGRERLLLWIGFIAALLVFAGGMFGSIILFTRQRQ